MMVLTATLSSWWLWAVSRVAASESASSIMRNVCARFPCLLGYHVKCLIQKRTHLTDLARSSNTGTEFEKHCFPMGIVGQSVAHAFGRDGLAGADIAGENNQRIPLCDRAQTSSSL